MEKTQIGLDGVVFNKSQTTLLRYPGGKAGSYAIPPGSVTDIGDYAYVSGSSFASPYAAGVAALVLSVNPSLNATNVDQITQQSNNRTGLRRSYCGAGRPRKEKTT